MEILTKPVPPAAPEPLLTVTDLSNLLGISVRSVWRLVSAGKLPAPLRLGTRLRRWRHQQLDEWLRALSEARR